VRLTVAVENYNWQHQDVRVENGVHYGDTVDHMDFPYLAKVAKLNIAALAAMASAPPPPEPKVEGAVSTDTTLTWWTPEIVAPHIKSYIIRWRRTDTANWERSRPVPGAGRFLNEGPRVGVHCYNDWDIDVGPNPFKCSVSLKGVRVDDWVFGVSSVSKDGFESPVASAVPGGAFKPYVAPPSAEKKP
jgi:hypothetical protein